MSDDVDTHEILLKLVFHQIILIFFLCWMTASTHNIAQAYAHRVHGMARKQAISDYTSNENGKMKFTR